MSPLLPVTNCADGSRFAAMVASYILILCISAWFTAYALLRVAERVAVLVGQPMKMPAGLSGLVALLAFLVVVNAPGPMIVGALALTGMGLIGMRRYLPHIATWGVPLIATLMAVAASPLPEIEGLPPLLVRALALLIPFGLAMGGRMLPDAMKQGSGALLACLAPLMAAPLLGAPSYLAIDAAIFAAALLGGIMAAGNDARLGLARAPMAFVLGWLIVQAGVHGAWMAAVASLLVYGGAIAYAVTQKSGKEPYAP